jgi:bifunctional DNA-binding transcriptional regulator/antitoxin component of YhaV-PrlF toxin-antitoxin module
MTTVTVDSAGSVDLPADTLKESRIGPGTRLLVLACEGKIFLLDAERFRERVEKPAQERLAQFRRMLAADPQMPFFGGLTLEEYGALSEEAEQELWDRLSSEAERQRKGVEHDFPSDVRPAG